MTYFVDSSKLQICATVKVTAAFLCSDFCKEASLFYFLISLVLDGVCWWLCAFEVFLVCDTDLECLAVFHNPGLF